MSDRFTKEFFAGNRARLRTLFTGTAPIVLTANGLLQRGGDSTYPFEQDASFWYLTGCEDPDVVLVMDKDREYFIVPKRSDSRQAFDGAVDVGGLSRRSGVKTVYDDREGWRQLTARLKRARHVATLAPLAPYIGSHGFYTNPARAQLMEQLKAINDQLELLDLTQHVVRMRMVKQPVELAALQAAIDITIQTLKTVSKPSSLKRHAHEHELEAAITEGFRRRGARGHAFEPIVASGKRACTLHNVMNDGLLKTDELVIMDVGASVDHYAADITRTVALGNPSKRQQAVYDTVLEVQEYAKSLLKPGIIMRDYEQQVEQYMGEKLRALGLIKTIEHREVRRYYPHATSHFLGLNVHDSGDYSLPLAAGMVLTVEPGIYIPEESIGVRIEDDVLVTNKGLRVLSKSLPRALGSPTIKANA